MAVENSRINFDRYVKPEDRTSLGNLYGGLGATKQPADELPDELVENAQRYGYDVQQLWNHHFGAMKRLVPFGALRIDR